MVRNRARRLFGDGLYLKARQYSAAPTMTTTSSATVAAQLNRNPNRKRSAAATSIRSIRGAARRQVHSCHIASWNRHRRLRSGPSGAVFAERDPGLTKDLLQRRDRFGIDLDLAKAGYSQLAFLVERPQHERPVVLRGSIPVRVVVDGDLEHRLVRTLPVGLPAPVLVEERGLEPAPVSQRR